ncbi:MAG TPA: HD domain-containing protein [Gammaproteobacteria bacterium]|nr:HD domain-containing protein [Gammaproteobacteria bacterium]
MAFAAEKHRDQRRKGARASPYINHPIAVAELLAVVGGISDAAALEAAVLHDTIEDTQTTAEELENAFGAEVRGLVVEVTDDKKLPKEERKRKQIEHAPHLSGRAKAIKIADKICNVRDMADAPPDWPLERRMDYLAWAEKVVAGCRGTNAELEQCFDQVLTRGRALLRAG